MFFGFAFLGLAGLASALPNVTLSGRYLYTPDGNRFYIKGVAYQPQGYNLFYFNVHASHPP